MNRKRSRSPGSPIESHLASSEEGRDRLAAELRYKIDDLDEAMPGQAQLVYEVGLGHALALSIRDGYKDELKRCEARAYARVKAGEKQSEAALKHALELDQELIDSRLLLQRLSKDANEWDALREACRARGPALHNSAVLADQRRKAIGGESYRSRDSDDGDRSRGRRVSRRRRVRDDPSGV